jgi:biopolymer transport protein ExbB/TolQ
MDTYAFVLTVIGLLFGLIIVWMLISSLNRYLARVKTKVDALQEDFNSSKAELKQTLADARSKQMSLVRSFATLKRDYEDYDIEDAASGRLPPAIESMMMAAGLDPKNPDDIKRGLEMLAAKFGGGEKKVESW